MNRRFLSFLGVAMLAAAPLAVHAQADYPNRAVRIIVPFPPGGATDVLSRLVAGGLEKRLKQPFVIENRPGALTQIGTEVVVKSPPDGYSLLIGSINIASEEVLNKEWPFRFERDLTPVAMFAGGGYAVTVTNSLPVANLKELIAYSKANPGKLNLAGAGGLSTDIAIMVHRLGMGPSIDVLYKGGPLAVQAVMTGEAHWVGASVSDIVELDKAGKVKVLAYTERERHPRLPHIPTVNEAAGIDDYDAAFWFLMAGPANLPPAIVARLNSAVRESMKEPDIQARVAGYLMRPLDLSVEASRARVVARIGDLRKLQAAGVKLR